MNYYRSVIRKVRRIFSLRFGDWSMLLKFWFYLLWIDILLRSRPFPRVMEFVTHGQKDWREPPNSAQAWMIIRRCQRFVLLAARLHPYKMECLRQALSLKKLLGGQGIPTELRFGVRKTGKEFLAHAWLEYEGRSIELSNTGETFHQLSKLRGHS